MRNSTWMWFPFKGLNERLKASVNTACPLNCPKPKIWASGDLKTDQMVHTCVFARETLSHLHLSPECINMCSFKCIHGNMICFNWWKLQDAWFLLSAPAAAGKHRAREKIFDFISADTASHLFSFLEHDHSSSLPLRLFMSVYIILMIFLASLGRLRH